MKNLNRSEVKKILVIKPSSLGDVLHAFPAVSILAELCPNAEIDWLINKPFASLLEFHPNVSNIILFPRKELGNILKFPKSFYTLAKHLRKSHYDIIIDFQGLMRSAFFAKIAKSSKIIGFSNPKEKISRHFYTHKIDVADNILHAVNRNINLVQSAFLCEPSDIHPQLKVIEKYRNSMMEKLYSKGFTDENIPIGLAPVARWKSKTWKPAFFANIINKLYSENNKLKFILIGVPDDQEAVDEILSLASPGAAISVAGETSIAELLELIRYVKCLICNDSGPMHIAAALEKTVFAMFGPTDPAKTGPFGCMHFVFQGDCSPCFKRECPDGNYLCQKTIEIQKISDSINLFLKNVL